MEALIIVESPTKARNIKRYLAGLDIEVKASVGHIIDLPERRMGVDLESGEFTPEYVAISGKGKVIEEIQALSKKAKIIYLAVTSRLFPWPLSVAQKGPSSAGKSFTVERTLRFFPNEAYLARTAMSERGLVYTDEDFQHRACAL